MRAVRKLLIAVVAAATLAGACGGGDDDETSDAAPDGTTTSTTAAGGVSTTATSAPAGDPSAATTTGVPVVPPDTTPIDPSTIETLPPPADPGPPPAPGFPPPDPGRYAYHTTGGSSIVGGPVDATTDTVVTSLGPNEIRYAAESQVLDLQYRPDGIYVRQLVMEIANTQIRFQSPDGVLFAPLPGDAPPWTWQLNDTTGGLTAVWSGVTRPAEPVDAAGATVQANVVAGTITLSGTYSGLAASGTMRLTLWIDPARRLPVKLHQILTLTSPLPVNIDTTSTLTGFTPG